MIEELEAFKNNQYVLELIDEIRETIKDLAVEIADLDFTMDDSRFKAAKLQGVREGLTDALDYIVGLKGEEPESVAV